jgi:hypothetical protein
VSECLSVRRSPSFTQTNYTNEREEEQRPRITLASPIANNTLAPNLPFSVSLPSNILSSYIHNMQTAVTNTTTNEPPEDTTTDKKPAEDNPKPAKKGISFGEVRVREHERVLNTRPSARYADLTLGWAHHSSQHYVLDDFEKIKEEEHHEKKKHKHFERVQVLAKYGYAPKDVITLEKDKKKAMERREKGVIEEEPEYIEAKPKPRGIMGFFSKK